MAEKNVFDRTGGVLTLPHEINHLQKVLALVVLGGGFGNIPGADDDESVLLSVVANRFELGATLQPKSELELVLVDRIVSLTWRLRRAGRIEAAILAIEQHEADIRRAGNEAGCYRKYSPSPFASRVEKPRILNRQKYEEALKKEAEVRSRMNGEEQILGRGYVKQAAHLANLHRYETTLERSLFKTMDELQRVQAMRLGVEVALPVAVDIQGDGSDS